MHVFCVSNMACGKLQTGRLRTFFHQWLSFFPLFNKTTWALDSVYSDIKFHDSGCNVLINWLVELIGYTGFHLMVSKLMGLNTNNYNFNWQLCTTFRLWEIFSIKVLFVALMWSVKKSSKVIHTCGRKFDYKIKEKITKLSEKWEVVVSLKRIVFPSYK